jgi:hypothetical protein
LPDLILEDRLLSSSLKDEVKCQSRQTPSKNSYYFSFINEGLTSDTHNINKSVARRCGFSPLNLVGSLRSSVWRVAKFLISQLRGFRY